MKKLEISFMNCLQLPPAKNVQYFTGLLYFSKFDKCDVKSHFHKVTGRNLRGRLPWPSKCQLMFNWIDRSLDAMMYVSLNTRSLQYSCYDCRKVTHH